ncbi:MAG TPA: FHA domain-containing protein [Myxococcales bacterium]
MPAAKPPPRKPAPKAPPEPGVDQTDPGGPPPDTLEKARRSEVKAGPGDATLVYDKNKAKSHSEPPKLVVTAGPRKGGEFALTMVRTTIGRGSDNVVVIPDISVSRQHVILEMQGERWVLLDQASGNGTLVNGKPVDRYSLQHGDEISMGDTVVQFVEPGGVLVRGAQAQVRKLAADGEVTAAKAPAQGAFKRRAPLYGAVLVALVIVFAAGMVRRAQRARLEAEAAAQRDESRALAQRRFEEGVALVKQGRWVEARDKLKIAAELDGKDAEIARYLESAEAEAPRALAVALAKAALARKDYVAARGALADVPGDSALAESAHETQQQLRAAMDGAVREARARVESGDASGAADLLDPVLAAEPSRADARAVKEAIVSQRRSISPAPRRDEPRAPPPAPEVAGILEAYLAGDIGAAIEHAEAARSPRASRLLHDLKQFDSSYKEGLARQQAKNPGAAIRAFDQAAAADRAISQGKEGRLGREVRKSLAALHTQLANLGGDESLPLAATHLRAALQNDPSNEQAQNEMRQVTDRAKELYLRGYVAKDSDAESARKAFKLVLDTLPSGDETAQKAKRWMDKLDGKVAKDE